MSEKKIDDKDLSNEDLGKLHELLSKINREVNQKNRFFNKEKYKTKQWREFTTDWKMNFDQNLLNDQLTLNNWMTKKDPGTLTCLIELLKIIIDHPDAHAHDILKQAMYLFNKLYQITTKIREHSINEDAKRQTIDIIKKCATKLAEEGYNYCQHYGHWLIALCNHINEPDTEKKQKLMIYQFKKDYHSKLGRIILRRPKELQIRLGSALVKLYNHNKPMIEMVTPTYIKRETNQDDPNLIPTLVMSVVLPALYRQCDIWKEKKFTVSKYNYFRRVFEGGNFENLLNIVVGYLKDNIPKIEESNKNKPKS